MVFIAITATLQAQNSTFIALAGKTAELDAELQKIKAVYRELWRTHTGSARDPFNEIDRRAGDGNGMMNGIGSLNLGR
jgi:nucleoporin p58/p45